MAFHFDIIETNSEFAELHDEWRNLLQKSKISSPFLTWEWMYSWWICYGEKQPTNSLCIVTSRDENNLIGILPGYVTHRRAFGRSGVTFRFLGSEYESSDYLDVIRKDTDGDLVEDLFKFMIKEKKVDMIALYNILEGQTVLTAINDLAGTIDAQMVVKHHRICPYLPLDGDWDSFVSGLSKNQRYNLRRRTRKLFEEFDAELSILEDAGELETAVDELFQLHEDRFKTKQEQSIFRADLRKDFHKKVAGYFLEKNILKLFRLSVENKVIASLYCYEFANKLFYFQFGMDPEWAKHSPGVVIMAQAIKYAIEKKLDYFDFMRGDEEYKFKWTDKVRNMVTIDLAVTTKGKQMLGLREFGLGLKDSIKTIVPEKVWSTLKEFGK